MLDHGDRRSPSLFTPENLLREARRQKGIARRTVPRVCVLDPDGDIVRYLRKVRKATRDNSWACYHTELFVFRLGRIRMGIVGCAVGSSFAVLVAEEMFASGCRLLISMTSAGRIGLPPESPRFLLLGRALRDEGTSRHYAAHGNWSRLAPALLARLKPRLPRAPVPLVVGASWTTDAPFRETRKAIAQARHRSADCVEMEAAALYAFAAARRKQVICLAHVTNAMAQATGDFEKGPQAGSIESLKVIRFVAEALGAPR